MKKSLADEAEVHLKFSAKVTPPWVGLTHPCAAVSIVVVVFPGFHGINFKSQEEMLALDVPTELH